jgi:hypothetical protein
MLLSRLRILLLLLLLFINVLGKNRVAAFWSLSVCRVELQHVTLVLSAARKPKPRMADKRRQRAKQQSQQRQSQLPFLTEIPSSQLDFRKSSPPLTTTPYVPAKTPDSTRDNPSAPAAMSKAQTLLDAQRKSIAVLTAVRTSIEQKMSLELVEASLHERGYWYVDNFLDDHEIVQQLQDEGATLLENGMTPDMTNLGSGEYTVALAGGDAQYVLAPRSVEWVVSATKHVPLQLPSLTLDNTTCMGVMRTFDRNAYQASRALLTDGDDQAEIKPRPFGTVATKEGDQRKITMRYYLVPDATCWNASSGGGLSFEDSETIYAVRNRLVLWKSDCVAYRPEVWKGSEEEGESLASCIELHLISTSNDETR